MSIEEVKARLDQLGWGIPMDAFNEANHKTLDVTAEMRVLIAGTDNEQIKSALSRIEQGNTMTIDGAMAIMEAREELWQIAQGL